MFLLTLKKYLVSDFEEILILVTFVLKKQKTKN